MAQEAPVTKARRVENAIITFNMHTLLKRKVLNPFEHGTIANDMQVDNSYFLS